jgi:hypothetical protein
MWNRNIFFHKNNTLTTQIQQCNIFFSLSARALKYFFSKSQNPKMERYVFFWGHWSRPLYILIMMPILDPISDYCLTESSLSPNFWRIIQAKTYTPFQTVVTKNMPHARHKIKNRIPIVRTSPCIYRKLSPHVTVVFISSIGTVYKCSWNITDVAFKQSTIDESIISSLLDEERFFFI